MNTVIYAVLGLIVLATAVAVVVVRRRSRDIRRPAPLVPRPPAEPVSAAPSDAAPESVTVQAPSTPDTPPPSAGRMHRLRARLARSQGLGAGLLGLLSRDRIDDATWDQVEELLLTADLGVGPTQELLARLRTLSLVDGWSEPQALHDALAAELLSLIDPAMDRSLRADRSGDLPGVLLVVGVNGTGKTTTVGKLARVLVGDGRSVVLAAADTFRAAAADQLGTWAGRVGAEVVRGVEGGDPAAVAFDAVRIGIERKADAVVIDTAGRLHTKVGLMDELGKVKRVVERQAPITEVLLVIDATTGQNGLLQARVFAEAVAVTGVVLTKLDGTAKGGIVVAVQRELGIPVKLVGLGEGPDDLAPFEPAEFVAALLATSAASS